MKLSLMSFSYIGNVVSAQLIHKETQPALKALLTFLRGGGAGEIDGLCGSLRFKQEKRQGE